MFSGRWLHSPYLRRKHTVNFGGMNKSIGFTVEELKRLNIAAEWTQNGMCKAFVSWERCEPYNGIGFCVGRLKDDSFFMAGFSVRPDKSSENKLIDFFKLIETVSGGISFKDEDISCLTPKEKSLLEKHACVAQIFHRNMQDVTLHQELMDKKYIDSGYDGWTLYTESFMHPGWEDCFGVLDDKDTVAGKFGQTWGYLFG